MTNQEILKKALDKAKANDPNYNNTDPWMNDDEYIPNHEFAIIFDHDFAKAFWGKKIHITYEPYGKIELPEWNYHLRLMVVEEDPIKYLEKYV